MYEGEGVTDSVVKTEIGAWWIVLGEAVPEISQNLGAYLSGCSTPYLQQLNLLAADTNGSASCQKIHQKISSWPVVNLSKWQVGMLTEMAFGFFIEKMQWWAMVDDSQKWKTCWRGKKVSKSDRSLARTSMNVVAAFVCLSLNTIWLVTNILFPVFLIALFPFRICKAMIICQLLVDVTAHKSLEHEFKTFQCYSRKASVHGGAAENMKVAIWKADPKAHP